MLCQNCNEREANVKYTQIINGVKKQMNLCDECAKNLGIDSISFSMPIDFSNFLGDIWEDNVENLMPTFSISEPLKCEKCNMTYDEFLQKGKFGCDECYNTFHSKIDALLKNIHGVNRHVGRNGKMLEQKIKNEKQKQENTGTKGNAENKKKEEKQEKIKVLQTRLKQEIKEERYEDAAKTRDEIKKLMQ